MKRIINLIRNNTTIVIISLFFSLMLFQISKTVITIHSSQIAGDDKYLLIMRSIAVIGIFAVVFISAYSIMKRKLDGKQLALICFMIGLVYMFAITPLSPPDEVEHFDVSYLLSNKIMNCGVQTYDGNKKDFDYNLFTIHQNVRGGYIWMIYGFNDPYIDGGTIQVSDDMWTFKYFLEYLPQALGLTIARLIHANQVWTFFSGRFTNLLFYSLCVLLAVKTAPVYKTMLGLISLLPIAMQQAASYSSDSFINGITLVYIALIIKMMNQTGKISATDMILTVIAIAILSPAKVAYTPLVLMIFLIPRQKFVSVKQYLIFIGSALVACLIMLCTFSVPILIEMLESSNENILSDTYTFQFILMHPLKSLSVIITTLFLSAGEYWNEAIGELLSGRTFYVPSWMILIYTFLLLLSVIKINNQKQICFNTNCKIVLFISALLVVFMIAVMEFVGWTPYGSSYVQGIQGRYFIPIIPVVLLLLDNKVLYLSKNIDKYLIMISVLMSARILTFIIDATIYTP